MLPGPPASQNSHDPLPHHSFLAWIAATAEPVLGRLIALASVGVLVTSLLYYGAHTPQRITGFLTPKGLQQLIFAAHVPFIVAFIGYLVAILEVNNVHEKRVQESHQRIFGVPPSRPRRTMRQATQLLKQFKTYFLLFWVSMFFLYLAFLVIALIRPKPLPPVLVTVPAREATVLLKSQVVDDAPHDSGPEANRTPGQTKDVMPPARSVQASLSEYEVQVHKLEGAPSDPACWPDVYRQVTEAPIRSWSEAFWHVLPEYVPFALNTLTLPAIVACLSLLYLPYQSRRERMRQRRFRNMCSLSLCALTMLYPLMLSIASGPAGYTHRALLGYTTLFNAISGTVYCVLVALLVARLDSKLIGLPSRLVVVLYSYAGVQPLFVVFAQEGDVNELIKTFVLATVFMLKIYFFFIIAYAMQTGRLLNYFYCFPTLNRRASSMFDNPYELRVVRHAAEAFGFVIYRKQKPVYSTERESGSREECEREASAARELMRNQESYKLRGELGSVTVEVVGPQGLVCSSADQRSFDDAEELVAESIEMIPYCAVRRK